MGEEKTQFLLEEIIELGKGIKNWESHYIYESQTLYSGSFDEINLDFKVWYGIFSGDKLRKCKINAITNAAKYKKICLGSYYIKKKHPEFSKIEELHKYILENINDQKKKIVNDALSKAKDLIKESKLNKKNRIK